MATDTKEKQQIKETTLKNTKLNVVKLNWKEVKPKISLLLATSALLVSTAWAQNESGFYRPLTLAGATGGACQGRAEPARENDQRAAPEQF